MSRQVIYVLGYPKSGTTWLSRLLGDTLNSPVGSVRPKDEPSTVATEGQDRSGSYYIRQGHAIPVDDQPSPVVAKHGRIAHKSITNEKIVIMVRDPRDVAVSAQHHWKMKTLSQAVNCMVFGKWPIVHGEGWTKWVKAWQGVDDTVNCWTSYEALSQATVVELGRILDSLDIDKPTALKAVVERQSFAVRRKWTQQHGEDLNYGKKFQLEFLRKGIIGDWKNHDWGDFYDLAMEHWGELMNELGYSN